MKLCRKCGVVKPRAEFSRRGARGLQPKCKACNAEYRRTHTAPVAAAKAAWAARHPARVTEIKLKYQAARKQEILARVANWKRTHPESRDADNLRRRTAHRNATPAWANEFFIREAYALARLRTKLRTGGVSKWHVDHVVPLRSKLVCGLHVENNLEVIPAVLNVAKNNRYWPDMPT